MGMLVDGVWHDVWYDTKAAGGAFVRTETAFRDRITADGSSGFPALANRYHLYVSLACPWAHRVLIYRALKGLEHAISLSVVSLFMGTKGWSFAEEPGCIADPIHGAAHLYEIYQHANPGYTGRVTVPVLWDKVTGTIVNNESSELIRMLNTEFDAISTKTISDLYPLALRPNIDTWNERIYHTFNNGVYRAGFASAQDKYDEAVAEVFATLDAIEAQLGATKYLCGSDITEADWRLFPTLVRFDAVYHGHFKCNLKRIIDYPNLARYTRELYAVPGVAETVNFEHIKGHYYRSHESINPSRIVPKGPVRDFRAA
ncbi:MAG: glutathione S-transferase family protein [Gammaproteobacteria bacterium]|nr:glutathione S-transferase family protein [Gammaproteobacteria bacterium]